jgi:hypothetical protein
MKRINKPVHKTPNKKAPATKQSAAKPKTKPLAKSKPRKAQGQAELMQVVARLDAIAKTLAQTAEHLEQTADRLTDATTGDAATRAHEATTQPPIPSYDETLRES